MFHTVDLLAQDNVENQEREFHRYFNDLLGAETNEIFYNQVVSTAIRGTTTHQYLNERSWVVGNIVYKGKTYFDLQLLYDIERQQLILRHPRGGRPDGIAPDMKLVNEFSMYGHTFRPYNIDQQNVFCQELYTGVGLSYIAMRGKKLTAQRGGPELSKNFKFYLVLKGETYTIKNTKGVQKIFPQYKQQIKALKSAGYKMNPRDDEASTHFFKELDSIIFSSK